MGKLVLASSLISIAALAACSSTSGGADLDDAVDAGPDDQNPGDPKGPDAGTPNAKPALQRCSGATFTPEPAGAFKHGKPSGSAVHGGVDTLVTTTQQRVVEARFAYGDLRLPRDLKDETIKAWLWDCKSWVSLGQADTDDEGSIKLAVPPSVPLSVGVYDIRFQVVGDATVAASTLWILPVGTHLVVSDIDGTLTTRDGEFLYQVLFDQSHSPAAYPGGVELLGTHVRHGYVIVYLTGRPVNYTQLTRDWLTGKGYPLGLVHLTAGYDQAFPNEAGVGTFKKEFLLSLERGGFEVDLAYGNAPTDISAYLGSGLPANKAWIIGENAGKQGTNPVMDTWAGRVIEVAAEPDVVQPFTW